jgi:hypothetical protein
MVTFMRQRRTVINEHKDMQVLGGTGFGVIMVLEGIAVSKPVPGIANGVWSGFVTTWGLVDGLRFST